MSHICVDFGLTQTPERRPWSSPGAGYTVHWPQREDPGKGLRDPPAGLVPVAGDLHYELAALGGATGQRPVDLHVQLECLG